MILLVLSVRIEGLEKEVGWTQRGRGSVKLIFHDTHRVFSMLYHPFGDTVF
jgi:hypothetical protein